MLGVFCARSSNFNVANKRCIHSNSLPDASVQNKLFGYLSIKCYSVRTAISLRVYEQKCYINVVRFLTCSNLCTKKKMLHVFRTMSHKCCVTNCTSCNYSYKVR